MRVPTTDRVTQSTKSLSTDATSTRIFGFPVFPGFGGRVGVKSTVTTPSLRDSLATICSSPPPPLVRDRSGPRAAHHARRRDGVLRAARTLPQHRERRLVAARDALHE